MQEELLQFPLVLFLLLAHAGRAYTPSVGSCWGRAVSTWKHAPGQIWFLFNPSLL